MKSENPPDVVIFDLDDTLIFQEPTNWEIVAELLKSWAPQPGELREAFFRNARSLWAGYSSFPLCRNLGISAGEGLWGEFTSPGMETLRREALEFRLKVWELTLSEAGLDSSKAPELRDGFIRLRRERHTWLPGAKEVLEALQGRYKLAVLTNGASDLQWFKVKASGIEKYFSQIVVSGDVGIGKPDARIFHHLTAAHPKGTSFLMVGNSLNSDIRGAANARISSVWLDREGEQLPADLKPWKVIRDMGELRAILL